MTMLGRTRYSWEDVCSVATPENTSTHVPIPHEGFVNEVNSVLKKNGFMIDTQEHLLDKEGARYFGLLHVRPETSKDYNLVCGIRNSHDKAFASGLVCGSNVLVCSNLCFSGEIKVGRKHTANINRDLPGLLVNAVERLHGLSEIQDIRMAAYREKVLTTSAANDLLIEALDSGVISSSKIVRVLKEWREPMYPEHATDGWTVWRMMQAFTEVQKSANVFDLPSTQVALHGILDASAGLDISANLKALAPA